MKAVIPRMLILTSLAATVLYSRPQVSSTTGAMHLSGVVSKLNGKYVLTDETSHNMMELHGLSMKRYVGHEVTLEAKPAGGPANAVQVVSVSDAGVAGSGAAAAGVAIGSAHVTTAALIAVGAAAATGATIGGLYASGAIGSSSTPVSRP